MRRFVSPLLLAASLALGVVVGGCATAAMSSAARDSLAKTASCAADQVKVDELGGSRYQASGCGKSETYICKAAEHAVVSCVPESSVPPLPDAPPAK